MVESIFQKLPDQFVAGTAAKPISFYFSLGECKKTVKITSNSCLVEEGRTVDKADCVCKTSPEFFEKIWREDYRPGMKDFMSGAIKSNNPGALQDFLRCFGKSA
jgi:putative sterol carrier protein